MENFDFNNIEKYLREGGDASIIANAFANKLNATINTMKAEKDLKSVGEKVSIAWNEYIDTYFGINKLPDGSILEDWYLDADEVGQVVDSAVKFIPMLKKYSDILSKISDVTEKTIIETKKNIPVATKSINDTFESTLNSFFKKYGI